MNLVIKNDNVTAPSGAGKVYRDALVSEGTLMLVDFENTGTTVDYDLSKGVFDLAREAAEELGVFTAPEVSLVNPIEITADRGVPGDPIGSTSFSRGVLFKGIGKYLYDNQPKCIVSVWIKLDMSVSNIQNSQMIRTNDVGTVGNIGIQSSSTVNPTISARMADKFAIPSSQNIGEDYTQVAIEFTGPTTPNKVYINGVYQYDGSEADGSFVENDVNDVLRIGHPQVDTNGPMTVYRMLVEDLDVSGRSAQEVVAKDYNYVNQLGDFSDVPTRRSYANVPA